jgi:hypothetical protein
MSREHMTTETMKTPHVSGLGEYRQPMRSEDG